MIGHERAIRDPLRVSFLTPGFGLGGAERWILSLSRNFQGCVGHTLGIVNGDAADEDLLGEARRYFKRVAFLDHDKPKQFARSFVGGDVVVAWGVGGSLGRLLDGCNSPRVYVSHSAANWYSNSDTCAAAVPYANFLAAVSATAARAFPDYLHSKIAVLYNGADVDRITPRHGRELCRRAWGLGENDKVLLYLGRYDETKNPLLVLQTLKQLESAADSDSYFGKWRAIFCGYGPLERSLRNYAVRELPGRVLFGYPQRHVGDLLAASDVFVLPSQSEGFPLAVTEAWLAGLPVVMPRNEFAVEMEGRHQLLCKYPDDPESPVSYADAVLHVTENYGEEFLPYVQAVAWRNYTASTMTARWERYLLDCLIQWRRESIHPVMNVVTENSHAVRQNLKG